MGPGEVDGELEGETAEECAKYGEVARVMVYEAKGPGVASDEAVRIFVNFRRQESAVKAGAQDRASNFMGLASLGLEIVIFCDFLYGVLL